MSNTEAGHKFQKAPVKAEGQPVDFGFMSDPFIKPKVETVYVERRVPKHLEVKAHLLISQFLIKHGYKPEEI